MKYLVIITILALFFILGCEPEYPDDIWSPTYESKPTPKITSIAPATGSFAAIGEITITGENFSTELNENHVYFNGNEGTMLTASATQLTVKVANVNIESSEGDTVFVTLRVDGAYSFATYQDTLSYVLYKLQKAALEFAKVDTNVHKLSGLAVDLQENVYLFNSLTEDIVTIAHPDSEPSVYGDYTFGPKQFRGIKVGPGGDLYLTKPSSYIYRVPAGGGSAERYFAIDNKAGDLDFDQNLNLYTGGDDGTIECIRNDSTKATVATYTDYEIDALRVFDGYVYIAADYDGVDPGVVQEGIWRNEIISANGDLGANELVFDWHAYVGGENPSILCFTMTLDGKIYIGQDFDNAVTILDPVTGSTEPLYPEVLVPPIIYMSWGNGANGNYLYINRQGDLKPTWKIQRVALDPSIQSAPYYGRQ